jgi:hypothetical protein
MMMNDFNLKQVLEFEKTLQKQEKINLMNVFLNLPNDVKLEYEHLIYGYMKAKIAAQS